MPILDNTTAPAVNLPVTGVDPTAAAAATAPVVTPVVQAPVLSAADAALIEATKAQFAGNAAAPAAGPADGSPAATAPAGDAGNVPSASDASTATAGVTGDASAPASGGDTPPQPELTASQKIAAKIATKKAQIIKLNEEVQRLEGQFRSADLLDSVKPGSVIKARVGRAETAREVTASVVGVQTLESGDVRYKVFFGEGFDAETVVIQSSQIVDVVQV